jgi:hypothetical protein
MDQPELVLFRTTADGKDLTIVVELDAVDGGREVADGSERARFADLEARRVVDVNDAGTGPGGAFGFVSASSSCSRKNKGLTQPHSICRWVKPPDRLP